MLITHTQAERKELLDFLTHPEWDHKQGPPPDKWNRGATADGPNLPKSYGLNPEVSLAKLRP